MRNGDKIVLPSGFALDRAAATADVMEPRYVMRAIATDGLHVGHH
jgi:hypothetical protein